MSTTLVFAKFSRSPTVNAEAASVKQTQCRMTSHVVVCSTVFAHQQSASEWTEVSWYTQTHTKVGKTCDVPEVFQLFAWESSLRPGFQTMVYVLCWGLDGGRGGANTVCPQVLRKWVICDVNAALGYAGPRRYINGEVVTTANGEEPASLRLPWLTGTAASGAT